MLCRGYPAWRVVVPFNKARRQLRATSHHGGGKIEGIKWVILNEAARNEPEVKDPELFTMGILPRS